MADGGEGTVEALVAATGGTMIACNVTGPLGEPVTASYGMLGDGVTAAIEMAAASGLPLVPRDRRDPTKTTTRGTGELMADALERGVRRIIVGIGGSATTDGGAGMAQALGYSLRDSAGDELPYGGAALANLSTIDPANRHPGLGQCEILVACDVTNPLCGPEGAARVYSPQKGASPADVELLDAALEHFGRCIQDQLDFDVFRLPGAGAAGGLGAGLAAFVGGQLRPGVTLVAEACGLREKMNRADLVITGEGRLDGQSIHGKTPVGVARIAQEQGIPVIAIAGALGPGYEQLYEHGINAAFSICPGPITLDEAMAHVRELLARSAEAVLRAWLARHRS